MQVSNVILLAKEARLAVVAALLHLLWLEYLQSHPEGYRYSQFCELDLRWTKKLHPAMWQRHRAGEKVFVDYSGKKLHPLDQRTGKILAVELFVGVLGAIGLIYAEATRTQTLNG